MLPGRDPCPRALTNSSIRSVFAARLVQARTLRGLSQRALGDLMGLGKEKGSSRINRYEHEVTAIGFDNLQLLAQILHVPVAYLVAETSGMADAILALSKMSEDELKEIGNSIPAGTMEKQTPSA